jgi:3-oxosteroid 1-dehydrogenase
VHRYDRTADLVIVGSGAGALVAANVAAARGADVLVLERSSKLGGGSAMSTGLIFIPNHPWMASTGIADSRDDGFAYLHGLNAGYALDDVIWTYLDRSSAMVSWVVENTPLKLIPVAHLPDFRCETAGGKLGGRHLAAEPFDGNRLGEWAERTRRSQSLPISYHEIEAMGGPAKIRQWNFELIGERMAADVRAQGAAIVAALVESALEKGVEFRTETRAIRLLAIEGAVRGVEVLCNERHERLGARAVILASGGFEWNAELNRKFLRGPMDGPLTVPTNEGDGQIMGAAIGAGLGLLHESVWSPVLRVPGEEYEGRPYWRNLASEKSRPHAIMVNRYGERFVNENLNYFDMGKAFHVFDTATFSYRNLPMFMIFDSAYKNTYPVGSAMPGESVPEWIAQGATLRELAGALGIDAAGLERTVARFNVFAATGVDEDFHRGRSAFDRYFGDTDHGKANPVLGALDSPPYYAIPVQVGTFGNRGGLTTNIDGAVTTFRGDPIPGLYACGNAMAQLVMGYGYDGGGTLAQAMTFGYSAANAVVKGASLAGRS